MAMIIKCGELPATPHTEYYYKEGVLALEEVHGSYGFNGPWSRKLHVRSYPTEQVQPPTRADFDFLCRTPPEGEILQPFLIQTAELPTGGDALRARTAVAYGHNTIISFLKPNASFLKGEFFRNGEKHEIYYVHEGEGVLQSEFGALAFRPEVYIIVPKGTTYRIDLNSPAAYLMLVESNYPIEWPPHYMNHAGQAHLVAPIVETEIEAPKFIPAIDQRGEFPIFVKHGGGRVTRTTLGHHPFDVGGWEGSLYPFVFDSQCHHGISREIHAEPPHHNTFQSGAIPQHGFSICTFRKHMEGWHPKDIPAPYAHYNVDSDELMFFCNTNYGARKAVLQPGSFTFHPGGCPHSPHGPAAKNSMAARASISTRLAIMLDTYFESMQITEAGYRYCDQSYATSWNEANHREDIASA